MNNFQRKHQPYNVDIVLATDPGVNDVIDFLHQQRRHDDIALQKGFTTAFVVAKNAEDEKLIGSVRLDLCTDYNSALMNDFLPAYIRPYISKLATSLHSSDVAFASGWVISKDHRRMKVKDMTQAMVVKGMSWAQSNGSQVMCANSKIRLATNVYANFGFRPLAGCYYHDKAYNQDDVPENAVCVVLGMHLTNFKLSQRVASASNHFASRVQRKAIEDCFPLYSANQVAEHSIAQSLEKLNASSNFNSLFHGVGTDDIAAIFQGAIQLDVQCNLALLLERDIQPNDCIFLISGELLMESASNGNSSDDHGYKITPGQRVDESTLTQASRIIATKDSRILMLSTSGVQRMKRAIAQQVDLAKTKTLTTSDNYSRLFMSNDAFDAEVKRLEQQAQLFKKLEIGVLQSAGLRNGTVVADVGCGTGAISITLAQELSDTKFVGIDSNEILLDKGRALSYRLGLSSRLKFSRSNVEQMALQASSVDFAYARLVLQHVRRPMKVISEMKRTVKPGGKVCVLDIDDSFVTLHPALEGISSMMDEVAQHQKKTGGDRFIGRKLFHIFTRLGLENVKVHLIPVACHELSPEGYYDVVYGFRKMILEETGRMDESRRELFQNLQQLLKKPTTYATTVAFLVEGTVPSTPSSRL